MPDATTGDDTWSDVDQYITYDKSACRWRWNIPRLDASAVTGSSDFRSEARGVVADYVRDKGPARVVRARTRFQLDLA